MRVEDGLDLVGPRPGRGEPEPASSAAAGEPGGDVQHPEPQQLRLARLSRSRAGRAAAARRSGRRRAATIWSQAWLIANSRDGNRPRPVSLAAGSGPRPGRGRGAGPPGTRAARRGCWWRRLGSASRRPPRTGTAAAPGWGRSRRTMTRIPAGQRVRSSRPVISATSAPSRISPSASTAGVHALSGTRLMASRTWSVTGNPTEYSTLRPRWRPGRSASPAARGRRRRRRRGPAASADATAGPGRSPRSARRCGRLVVFGRRCPAAASRRASPGVVAPHPDRVEPEAALEGRRRLLLLRVRGHQRGVDVEHHRLAEIGAGDRRGRQPPPGSCAHTCRRTLARAFSIRRSAAGVISSRVRHTVGGDATGPSTWLWWRSTSMSAIASPPAASIVATSTSTRPRSWTGTEPAPRQRRRQAVGQADPVGQQPHRHAPGQRHHPGPVGGDRQPRRPRRTLHLGSAFRSSMLNRREVQYLVARQALSRIPRPVSDHDP